MHYMGSLSWFSLLEYLFAIPPELSLYMEILKISKGNQRSSFTKEDIFYVTLFILHSQISICKGLEMCSKWERRLWTNGNVSFYILS
jgi:hypothetical protein